MFAPLLAVLVALGLLMGSAQAHDPSGPRPAPALVEEIDDTQELMAPHVDMIALEENRRAPALMATDAPPRYHHLWFVFRPPRAYAFN